MTILKFDRENNQSAMLWDRFSSEEREETFSFCEKYKDFLDKGKTEREAVEYVISKARNLGFTEIDDKKSLKPGDRVFSVNRHKEVALAVIGQKPTDYGISLIGAHLDSPRLDLKPEPLYEEEDLSLMKTHYYGGIKKYQWVGIPLSLHGIVAREDGSVVKINLGETPGDPVFTITDLLPHLAKDQMEKKMSEGIVGEALNILAGSMPLEGKEAKQRIKQGVLSYLKDSFGFGEEDLISAELQLVPAWAARDVGFDRGLLAGYGQDDRVCAYCAFSALAELAVPPRTAVVLLVDREEVGNAGNTGMQSAFFENFLADIIVARNEDDNHRFLRKALSLSCAISADVNAAIDPNYEEVMDKLNASRLGRGVVLTKYTGSRGKSGSSEARAEYVAMVRSVLNTAGVIWQTGELGKIDQGGGGTIAYLVAAYNMDVVDCGVALLGMHSPFEVASKGDIIMAYKAYKAFLQKI